MLCFSIVSFWVDFVKDWAFCKSLLSSQFPFGLQVVLDSEVPHKYLHEIKSVLISALASHKQLPEALLIYEEVKKAGLGVEPKAVISLIVRFCIISDL